MLGSAAEPCRRQLCSQVGIRASSREGIEPEEVRLGDLEVGGLQVSTDLLLVLAVVY